MQSNYFRRLPFFLVFFFPLAADGQLFIGDTQVDTNVIVTGLDTPWEILWGTDNHLWFTERGGQVKRLNPQTGEFQLLVDIGAVHEESESGLLGMVLHPDFPSEPYVYLVYNYRTNDVTRERVVRYTYAEGLLSDEQLLLGDIAGARNHNGSRLAVGPDRKLYITTGDSQDKLLPQETSSLNGKVLRMNLDGSIPEDNPIAGSYLWTFGHRNPQGLVFGREGILYSSEHGPTTDDEINIIEKGRNYGWPDVAGFCNLEAETGFCSDFDVREPLVAWTPTLAVCGLDYYGHTAIPEWQNSLLMTTLKNKTLWSLKLSEDGRSIVSQTTLLTGVFGRLRDVCVAPDGRVFLITSNRDGNGTPTEGDDKLIEIKPVASIPSALRAEREGRVELYPNPVTDKLTVKMHNMKGRSIIRVYNSDGRLMLTDETEGNQFEMLRSGLPSGFYLLQVENSRQSVYTSFLMR